MRNSDRLAGSVRRAVVKIGCGRLVLAGSGGEVALRCAALRTSRGQPANCGATLSDWPRRDSALDVFWLHVDITTITAAHTAFRQTGYEPPRSQSTASKTSHHGPGAPFPQPLTWERGMKLTHDLLVRRAAIARHSARGPRGCRQFAQSAQSRSRLFIHIRRIPHAGPDISEDR